MPAGFLLLDFSCEPVVNILKESKEAVNYYHKALHLGYCTSPRSASKGTFPDQINRKYFYLVGATGIVALWVI